MIDRTLGDGVYYAIDDYARFPQRVLAMVIDAAVLLAFGTGLWMLLVAVFWDPQSPRDLGGIFFVIWLFGAWFYLTVLKRSRTRTVGYRLLRLQIVTTKGGRPSLWAMTVRTLMWMYGPFNLLLDLCWLGADSEQQTLHDCYAGTYVVRAGAAPLGAAPVHLAHYCGGGLALIYPRVVRPAASQPKPA